MHTYQQSSSEPAAVRVPHACAQGPQATRPRPQQPSRAFPSQTAASGKKRIRKKEKKELFILSNIMGVRVSMRVCMKFGIRECNYFLMSFSRISASFSSRYTIVFNSPVSMRVCMKFGIQ